MFDCIIGYGRGGVAALVRLSQRVIKALVSAGRGLDPTLQNWRLPGEFRLSIETFPV